jgi:hypothetical protein
MTHEGALHAWETRRKNQVEEQKRERNKQAWDKAHAAERASKKALVKYCVERGWRVAFFEGKTGSPRTGIIDAIAYRLGKHDADRMELRLIQLKGGKAGITAEEIGRLKGAVRAVEVKHLIAEFDAKREVLELMPDELEAA